MQATSPSVAKAIEAKGCGSASKASCAPLRPMPASPMPQCTWAAASKAMPASSRAARQAVSTEAIACSMPSRVVAGPAMPEPRIVPLRVLDAGPAARAAAIDAQEQRAAHGVASRRMRAPQRTSLRSSAS